MSVRHTSELSGWTGEPGDPEEKRLGWRHRCGGDATTMTFESVRVDEATREPGLWKRKEQGLDTTPTYPHSGDIHPGHSVRLVTARSPRHTVTIWCLSFISHFWGEILRSSCCALHHFYTHPP